MRVLVTGGSGFIGGVAVRRLLARGDEVVVFARSLVRARGMKRLGAKLFKGDIRDRGAVAEAAEGCEIVVHAAGLPRPATLRAFRTVHVEGTRNVLRAARAAGAKRVVHIASQAVLFGGRDLLDVDESCPYPARFIDPYSQTKAAAEKLALSENGQGGVEVTSLRPAVVWGRGDTTVLPILARVSRSPLGLPMCGDGSNIEATTHIENLAEAMVAALRAPAAPGRAYIITDPFTITWREFISRQLEAAGIPARFFRVPRALAVPAAWTLDRVAGVLHLPVPLAYFGVRTALTSRRLSSKRAREELGYRPRVGLEEGLAGLREWVAELGGARALAHLHRG